ncbi:MAG TPA: hypothetical protein VFN53_13960 [Acidobacteriaceae bacterium]|nr:hypothetical protein [Acidobacteriaceae bacterium]
MDAPTVAVLWCWFFAAAFGITFRWMVLPTLALGTWCVYIGDRLLDGLLSAETMVLRDRHWFYVRHRTFFTIAWIGAAIPLTYLILFKVQRAVRNDDILLGVIGASYFLVVHGFRRGPGRWLPKELAVGFLFAIATAVPAWARTGAGADHGLLGAAVLAFGAVCWLNCVCIQVWEDAEAEQELTHEILATGSYGGRSPARSDRTSSGLPPWPGQHLTKFAIILAAASLSGAGLTGKTPACPLFLSVALSSFLFVLLIRWRANFSVLTLRIAADAALLTPVLFLLRWA